MAMGMAGVEVVDRDPVELRSEVLLHLLHHVAGEGAKVGKLVAVFGRDDESELMAILSPLLQKRAAVRQRQSPLRKACLSFLPGRSRRAANNADARRLPCSRVSTARSAPSRRRGAFARWARAPLPPASIDRPPPVPDRCGNIFLSGVDPAPSRRRSRATAALRRRLDADALRLRYGLHHLRDEGAWSPRGGAASITNFSGAESKVRSVVAAHAQELAPATPENKPQSAQLASWR